MKEKDPYYERLDKEFVHKYKKRKDDNKWIKWGWNVLYGFVGVAGAYAGIKFFSGVSYPLFFYSAIGLFVLSIILLIIGYKKRSS